MSSMNCSKKMNYSNELLKTSITQKHATICRAQLKRRESAAHCAISDLIVASSHVVGSGSSFLNVSGRVWFVPCPVIAALWCRVDAGFSQSIC